MLLEQHCVSLDRMAEEGDWGSTHSQSKELLVLAAVPALQLSLAYSPMDSLPGISYSGDGFGYHESFDSLEQDVPLSLANGSMLLVVHELVQRFRYKLIHDQRDRTWASDQCYSAEA